MILASFSGEELFNKTRDQFLQNHSDPFLQTTFANIISKNLNKLVDNKQLHEWKEILAYSVIYSDDGGKKLAKELGNELLSKRNDIDNAIICFIVANEFALALNLWMKKLKHELGKAKNTKQKSRLIHKIFEKAFILRSITNSFEPNQLFDELVM